MSRLGEPELSRPCLGFNDENTRRSKLETPIQTASQRHTWKISKLNGDQTTAKQHRAPPNLCSMRKRPWQSYTIAPTSAKQNRICICLLGLLLCHREVLCTSRQISLEFLRDVFSWTCLLFKDRRKKKKKLSNPHLSSVPQKDDCIHTGIEILKHLKWATWTKQLCINWLKCIESLQGIFIYRPFNTGSVTLWKEDGGCIRGNRMFIFCKLQLSYLF